MLEDNHCLFSRSFLASCEQDSNWAFMRCHLQDDVSSGKRPPEGLAREPDEDRIGNKKKSPRRAVSGEGDDPSIVLRLSDRGCTEGRRQQEEEVAASGEKMMDPDDLSSDYYHKGDDDDGFSNNLEDDGDDGEQMDSAGPSDGEAADRGDGDGVGRMDPDEPSSFNRSTGYNNGHGGDRGHQFDSSSLISALGRDISINCLVLCSRSDYSSLASLNRSFRSLIQSDELYKLRRRMGIVEHWVYFSCSILEWSAFDPYRRRWKQLPRILHNECFMQSDKESLAVGTELLVFGWEGTSHVVLRYSILTNAWSSGAEMNTPRCLFGSASLGEIAIVAGGCSGLGLVATIYNSAEMYNSDTQTWVSLPSMNTPRKMCSGFFMDRKFYVIGGVNNTGALTCGEEFDLESRTWRVIPNMFPAVNGRRIGAPPLVAVVNNELYAADYVDRELRKYDKKNNTWITLGKLPERPVSVNGWGLAFRACGERLIVIGGPRTNSGGYVELSSWVPTEGPPEWELLATKPSGSFVYNCAVMGC